MIIENTKNILLLTPFMAFLLTFSAVPYFWLFLHFRLSFTDFGFENHAEK